jgi:predicted secreted hydrolase
MDSNAPDGRDALNDIVVVAGGSDFRYELQLTAGAPLVFHGDRGYSIKSALGQASYYYSQPFYRVEGSLEMQDGPVAVTGNGWLDREWSSQPLASDQEGWDWFSLSFASGPKLMAFQLRGSGPGFTSGTWILPDGRTKALQDGSILVTPLETAQVAGRSVPVVWQVQVPEFDVDVRVSALNKNSWMATSVPYWEGPVDVEGSHDGQGYLEMTGYE